MGDEMKYIVRSEMGVKIESDSTRYLDFGLIEYINTLCIKELITYKGRIEATRKKLDIQSNIPVFISQELLLFPTVSVRNWDCFFINYFEVLSVTSENGKAIIFFNDLTQISLDIGENRIFNQVKKCEQILSYLENL